MQYTTNENWRLTVWGVRGSFPAPATEYLEYGGNTSCLSLLCGGELVVFDAGSGLAVLGDALASGRYPADIPLADSPGSGRADKACAFPGKYRLHLFLSHFHLDHVMGLFPFQPFHNPDAQIHLYGPPCGETGFRQCLEAFVGRPLWPLGLGDFLAEIHFHQISPGEAFPLASTDITVRAMGGSHPGGSLYYRLEDSCHSMVYALDCELEEQGQATQGQAEQRQTEQGQATQGQAEQRQTEQRQTEQGQAEQRQTEQGQTEQRRAEQRQTELADFVREADLCVWDANFTHLDLKKGWGHSTWEQGLALGQKAGVGTMLMTHYSRQYTDAFLREQERLAEEAVRAAGRQELSSSKLRSDGKRLPTPEQTAGVPQPLALSQAAGKKRTVCRFAREQMEILF